MKKYYDYLKKIEKKRAEKISLDRYYDFKSDWSERFIKAKTKEERDAIHAEHEKELKKRDEIIKHNEFIDVELSIMKNNALVFCRNYSDIVKALEEIHGRDILDIVRPTYDYYKKAGETAWKNAT